MMTKISYISKTPKIAHVYPRLSLWAKMTNNHSVKKFAEAANLSQNTVSKIFNGGEYSVTTLIKCQEVAKNSETNFSGVFDFEKEKMAAEVTFAIEDVRNFIGNRSEDKVAKILGIEEYLLKWILKGKPISKDIADKIIKKAK